MLLFGYIRTELNVQLGISGTTCVKIRAAALLIVEQDVLSISSANMTQTGIASRNGRHIRLDGPSFREIHFCSRDTNGVMTSLATFGWEGVLKHEPHDCPIATDIVLAKVEEDRMEEDKGNNNSMSSSRAASGSFAPGTRPRS